MFAIIHPNGHIMPMSLHYYKNDCISSFIYNTTMEWEEVKKLGWNCKKVNVNIQII